MNWTSPKVHERYAKLLGSFWRHRKTLGLPDSAFALYAAALSWSMDTGSDGFVPVEAIQQIRPALTRTRGVAGAAELVKRGLWETAEGGYAIHGWREVNPSVEHMEQKKISARRSVMARWGGTDTDRTADRTADRTTKAIHRTEDIGQKESKPEASPDGPTELVSVGARKNGKRLSDDEFVAALKANPAYRGIDIGVELGKMDAWFLANPGRLKTQRFVVNWLNKIDRGMGRSATRSIVSGGQPVGFLR